MTISEADVKAIGDLRSILSEAGYQVQAIDKASSHDGGVVFAVEVMAPTRLPWFGKQVEAVKLASSEAPEFGMDGKPVPVEESDGEAVEPDPSTDESEAVATDDDPDVQEIDPDAYETDEELVLALVEANGSVPQKLIHQHVPVSRGKVSIILGKLAQDGAIVHERLPGVNAGKVARVADDYDASPDPDEDASDASEEDDDGESEDPDVGDEPQRDVNGLLDPDDPEDLEWAYENSADLAEVARRFPLGRTAIHQRLIAHGIVDEPDAGDAPVETLELASYGESGQTITPEMLIDALDGAHALYHLKRDLRLADREIEDICRRIGLLEDLRNGTGKIDRAVAERRVLEAVSA